MYIRLSALLKGVFLYRVYPYIQIDVINGNLPPPMGIRDTRITNNQKVFKRGMNYEAYANNSLR